MPAVQTQTCTWSGKSGTQYTYYVHELPITFDPDQAGNYIYTKINQNGNWVPVYIGEGDLRGRVSDDHHQARCIKSKGATHVHAHKNGSASARKNEETDLLENYSNAYQPFGCNVKEGG